MKLLTILAISIGLFTASLAMEKPWFEHGRASEDLIFCDKVYELGLGPIYCDLGARLGHMSPAALWPSHANGEWEVGFALADGFQLTVPISG